MATALSVFTSIKASSITNDIPSSGNTLIGTHDGSFHCDEALACGKLNHNFKSVYV